MQAQHAQELAHATAIRTTLAQSLMQRIVGRWPGGAPLPHGLGMLKGTWALQQQRQVMLGLANILVLLVAARMAGNDTRFIGYQHLDLEGKRTHGHRVFMRRISFTGNEYRFVSKVICP